MAAKRRARRPRIPGGHRTRTSTTGLDHWTTAVGLAVLPPRVRAPGVDASPRRALVPLQPACAGRPIVVREPPLRGLLAECVACSDHERLHPTRCSEPPKSPVVSPSARSGCGRAWAACPTPPSGLPDRRRGSAPPQVSRADEGEQLGRRRLADEAAKLSLRAQARAARLRAAFPEGEQAAYIHPTRAIP